MDLIISNITNNANVEKKGIRSFRQSRFRFSFCCLVHLAIVFAENEKSAQ